MVENGGRLVRIVPNDGAFVGVGRNHNRRHANPQAIEPEGISGIGIIGIIAGCDRCRGRLMIVESSVFIKGDNEHGIRPILRIAECLVHAFNERLPFPDVIEGMHGIAVQIVVPSIVAGLDKCVFGQVSFFDI